MLSFPKQTLSLGFVFVFCFFLSSCDVSEKIETTPIPTKTAGAVRSVEATETLTVEEVEASLSVSLSSSYKVWARSVSPQLDVVIKNNSSKHASAITLPTFNIYDVEGLQLLTYAKLDLASGHSLGPGRTSVISIPIASQKALRVLVKELQWIVSGSSIQSSDLNSILDFGQYKIRLELSVFDRDDVEIAKLKSNFVGFKLE